MYYLIYNFIYYNIYIYTVILYYISKIGLIYYTTYLYEWRTKLLLAMDMAKVGGPLSVVKVFTQNLNIPSPLPTTLVFR